MIEMTQSVPCGWECGCELCQLGVKFNVLNKTKIVVRTGDYVDIKFIVNNISPEKMEALIKVGEQPRMTWSACQPQFLEANLMWQKVHPDLVCCQGWNANKTIYTVRTHYIRPYSKADIRSRLDTMTEIERWSKDVTMFLDLIDVMGFEKAKDDMCEWNIHHGTNKQGEHVSYIIDWDEIIPLGSEESAYCFYKEEMCRWQHSRAYFNQDALNTGVIEELEEKFDTLWRAKVG